MNPSNILKEIVHSNNEFVREHDVAYFTPHLTSQNPSITMVSCSDSRVQPGAILKDPVNRIFEIENIGNQISTNEGSVDYGVLHLKTPVLMILGHSDCGAIKAFMTGYEKIEDPIRKELDNLKPAGLSKEYTKENFEEILFQNIQKNVDYQIDVAAKKYKHLIQEEKLTAVGAFYDFKNDFGMRHGRMMIINVNCETDENKIKNLSIFENIRKEDIMIGRV